MALLAVLLVCLAVFQLQRRHGQPKGPASVISPELFAQFSALESREQQLDQTLWARERAAEQCGAVFDALWDGLNQTSNKFDVLASFPIGELVVGKYGAPESRMCGIQIFKPSGGGQVWLQQEWQQFLAKAQRDGWRLEHIEFRNIGLDTQTNGAPQRSRISFRADVRKVTQEERATLEGALLVDWVPNTPGPQPVIKHLDASKVSVRSRRGPVPFQPVLTETIPPPEKWLFIDPLILYDLDGDGFPEIILAGKNLVYRRGQDGQYTPQPLCQYDPGRILSAVIADFDGDGVPDLLCAKPAGLFLFKGSPGGTFNEPGRLAWAANPPLKYAQVITCGDIDHDGDLDVFLGQYKNPYFRGQMPAPFYAANDGHPAYLLLNDGKGNFTDATQSAGLAPKRWRRTYSASFARFGGDANLDLVVVSDFAGLDFYRNDGHGHFRDATEKCIPDPMGFGMAHAVADFNADGEMDLLMIGMSSPTVKRLDHLRLWRPDAREEPTARTRLTSGNRLLLGRADGAFEQAGCNESLANSGWSWGCSAFDCDNDGFPDVYIANGHESRASVQEYEPEFWLHDLYVAGSTNNRLADLYFQSKFTRTRGRGQSYGGYEINRLYLSQQAHAFLEAGYLMGVGLEQDCRNVVTGDLDGDGRVDLLVTTFEVWPVPKQTLRVYRNTLPASGNWIGFRLREARGRSPVGATVTIRYGTHSATSQVVTGDSYRSQSANTLHFGLGKATRVDRAEITWADGTKQVLEQPAVNEYHSVSSN